MPTAGGRPRHRAAMAPGSGASGRYAPVGTTGERDDTVRRQQPGGDVLTANGLGHGHHERGGSAVEPAIAGVRPHRLRDVTGAHDGSRRRDQAIRDRGQPVLLAAMHVHDVGGSGMARAGGEDRPPSATGRAPLGNAGTSRCGSTPSRRARSITRARFRAGSRGSRRGRAAPARASSRAAQYASDDQPRQDISWRSFTARLRDEQSR